MTDEFKDMASDGLEYTPEPKGLRTKAIHGMCWTIIETLANKCTAIICQFVLAWLLIPDDFGLIGLSYTVIAFINLMTEPGIQTILIQRQTEFNNIVSSAFWISLSLGFIGAFFIAIVSPFAAFFYHEPRLIGLLLILTLKPILSNISLVNITCLNIDMRFKTIAVVNTVTNLISIALTIMLAALHFGPYSIAIPQVILALIQTLTFCILCPIRIHSPQFNIIKTFYRDTVTLFSTRFFWTLINQGDYIVLGYFYDSQIVGVYYFAFNLSLQVLQLFQNNLSRVLFPMLSILQNDTQRQINAFLKVTSILAIVSIPFGFLQTALADSIIHLIFQTKWWASILPLQILSIGMGIRVTSAIASPMMQAQRRYRTQLLLSIISAAMFLIMVISASYFGQLISVSLAVALHGAVILGPVEIYVAGYPYVKLRKLMTTLCVPVIAALMALGISKLMFYCVVGFYLFPSNIHQRYLYLIQTLITAATFAVTYLLIIYYVKHDEYKEILHIFNIRKKHDK